MPVLFTFFLFTRDCRSFPYSLYTCCMNENCMNKGRRSNDSMHKHIHERQPAWPNNSMLAWLNKVLSRPSLW